MRLVLAIAAIAAIVIALWGDGGSRPPPAARAVFSPQPAAAQAIPPVPAPARAAVAVAPLPLHAVEALVRQARINGQGENEVYRLRAAHLPAAQAAALSAMESAEAEWKRRLAALRAACAAHGADCSSERARHFSDEEVARLRSYEAPALRQ